MFKSGMILHTHQAHSFGGAKTRFYCFPETPGVNPLLGDMRGAKQQAANLAARPDLDALLRGTRQVRRGSSAGNEETEQPRPCRRRSSAAAAGARDRAYARQNGLLRGKALRSLCAFLICLCAPSAAAAACEGRREGQRGCFDGLGSLSAGA